MGLLRYQMPLLEKNLTREREREREREFHTKRPFDGIVLGICPLTGAKNIS